MKGPLATRSECRLRRKGGCHPGPPRSLLRGEKEVPGCGQICRDWAAYGDAVCEDLTAEQQARCLELFRACSRHELNFWHMSERPREDITIRIG